METPLNAKQIQNAQAIFILVCLLTVLLIASQVFISLSAKDSINYKVSTYTNTTPPLAK
jgi:hypothetical protein